jgi:hypothetical protein
VLTEGSDKVAETAEPHVIANLCHSQRRVLQQLRRALYTEPDEILMRGHPYIGFEEAAKIIWTEGRYSGEGGQVYFLSRMCLQVSLDHLDPLPVTSIRWARLRGGCVAGKPQALHEEFHGDEIYFQPISRFLTNRFGEQTPLQVSKSTVARNDGAAKSLFLQRLFTVKERITRQQILK